MKVCPKLQGFKCYIFCSKTSVNNSFYATERFLSLFFFKIQLIDLI